MTAHRGNDQTRGTLTAESRATIAIVRSVVDLAKDPSSNIPRPMTGWKPIPHPESLRDFRYESVRVIQNCTRRFPPQRSNARHADGLESRATIAIVRPVVDLAKDPSSNIPPTNDRLKAYPTPRKSSRLSLRERSRHPKLHAAIPAATIKREAR
ncbi:hypothetical protein [Novipirellula rosea]|uniref:hypothetical protein n=1 Tax=Novipirellula rosea TaxID=1031540 RepID=UPI0031E543CC